MLGRGLHATEAAPTAAPNKPADRPATAGPINPSYYSGDLVMRIIERFKLGFCLGNVIKYVLRHETKNGLEDLEKAAWYLQREIAWRKGEITKTVE